LDADAPAAGPTLAAVSRRGLHGAGPLSRLRAHRLPPGGLLPRPAVLQRRLLWSRARARGLLSASRWRPALSHPARRGAIRRSYGHSGHGHGAEGRRARLGTGVLLDRLWSGALCLRDVPGGVPTG